MAAHHAAERVDVVGTVAASPLHAQHGRHAGGSGGPGGRRSRAGRARGSRPRSWRDRCRPDCRARTGGAASGRNRRPRSASQLADHLLHGGGAGVDVGPDAAAGEGLDGQAAMLLGQILVQPGERDALPMVARARALHRSPQPAEMELGVEREVGAAGGRDRRCRPGRRPRSPRRPGTDRAGRRGGAPAPARCRGPDDRRPLWPKRRRSISGRTASSWSSRLRDAGPEALDRGADVERARADCAGTIRCRARSRGAPRRAGASGGPAPTTLASCSSSPNSGTRRKASRATM